LFSELVPLTEEELGLHFDALAEMAARQPDDKLVFDGLSRIINEVSERGEVGMMMQMAMTLGAMACIDDHFEGLAGQASDALANPTGKDDGHGHDNENNKKPDHDSKHCKACQANKPCRYRK
jgi:hypothetical protein